MTETAPVRKGLRVALLIVGIPFLALGLFLIWSGSGAVLKKSLETAGVLIGVVLLWRMEILGGSRGNGNE